MDTATDSRSGPVADAPRGLWDTVIVGGSAAGLSAGVVLARAQFDALVADGGVPRNGPADHMHGYLTREGMAPKAFVAIGQDEYIRYGGTLVQATVADARRCSDGTFELRLGHDRFLRARSVLVATGLTDELPDIPGLSERWASQVHHCPHCHGYELRGRVIAVIGSTMSDVSTHLAALLRRYTSSVTFCINDGDVSDAERKRLEAYGVRVIDARVMRVANNVAETREAGLVPVAIDLDNGQTVVCEAIFVAPRPAPHDAILTTLGAAMDPQSGLVAVDAQGATSVPGLWAAGNVINPRAQVITAAGAGSTAAINMTSWLLEQDLIAAVSSDGFAVGGEG